MAVKIQLRGDTKANWNAVNPILSEREMVIESDTNRQKVGNGIDRYNDLPYSAGTLTPEIETITRPTRTDRNIIFEGNSRTTDWRSRSAASAGLAASECPGTLSLYADRGFYSYAYYLMQLPNFKDRFNYYNWAIWGNGNITSWFAPVLSDHKYYTDIYPLRPEANGGETGISEAWIFIQSSLIDTWQSNPTSVVSAITAKRNYLLRAKADGFKVVVLGEYFGYSGSYIVNGVCNYTSGTNNAELARIKYNNAMMEMAAKGEIDMYIDLDHLFEPNLSEATKDQYHFDLIAHMTGAAHQLIAEYVNSLFSATGNLYKVAYNRFINLPAIFNKVDKVSGKQLSTNDYTTNEKNKLANIPVKETTASEQKIALIGGCELVEGQEDPWYINLFSGDINLAWIEEQNGIEIKKGTTTYFVGYATAMDGGIQMEFWDYSQFEDFDAAVGDITAVRTITDYYVSPNQTYQKLNIAKGSGKLLPEYADNNAALVGGLVTGDIYRTGAILKVVL